MVSDQTLVSANRSAIAETKLRSQRSLRPNEKNPLHFSPIFGLRPYFGLSLWSQRKIIQKVKSPTFYLAWQLFFKQVITYSVKIAPHSEMFLTQCDHELVPSNHRQFKVCHCHNLRLLHFLTTIFVCKNNNNSLKIL